MLQTKEVNRVYKELEQQISEEEFNPIKNKIRFYLEHYTANVTKIYKIRIEYRDNKISAIVLYYTPNRYRRICIDGSQIFHVMHFEELENGTTKSLYGIQGKSLFNINKCSM